MNAIEKIEKLLTNYGMPKPINLHNDGEFNFYVDWDLFSITFYKSGKATFLKWDNKKSYYKKQQYDHYYKALDQGKKILGMGLK